MDHIPFLTAWDPRQSLKGSRDPLGAMALWTHQGRRVIGNLTTVSTQVRDFTVTLLGYYLVGRQRELEGPGREAEVFLKWEQLAAYVRAHVLEEGGFRGVERTRNHLSTRGPKVTLSTRSEHLILGDQKVYGLMGTYTMPARSSGLLEGDPIRLTPAALRMVETGCLPRLQGVAGKHLDGLARRLAGGEVKVELDGRDEKLALALGGMLKRRILSSERPFYQKYLLFNAENDTTEGRQQVLAAHLLSEPVQDWNMAALRHLARTLKGSGEPGRSLAHYLERIAVMESVLGPVGMLFGFLQTRSGQTLSSVVEEVTRVWGPGLRYLDPNAFEELKPSIAEVDPDGPDRWSQLALALREGRFGDTVKLVLDQNRAVMQRRGAAAWIDVKAGRLDVRYKDATNALDSPEHLVSRLRHPYFMSSLQGMANQLKA